MTREQELINTFFRATFFNENYGECINWALKELEDGSEDENVMILAGLEKDNYWEIKKYIERIIKQELVRNKTNDENWAGKYILELANQYFNNRIGIMKMDVILSRLYYRLDCPDWLSTLTRNCEYATDSHLFEKPFEEELKYIADLWKENNTIIDFQKEYDRRISDSHDVP
jgi:hypothetical protein